MEYTLKTADITYTESDKIKHKRINSNKGFANYDLKDLFDKKINTMTFLNENYKKHPYENDFSLHIDHIQSNSIDLYLCLNLKSTGYFEIYTELYNMLSYCFDIMYGAFHIDDNFRDPECLVRGILSFSLIDEPELSLIELIKSEKWKALHNLLNKTGFIV